MYSRSRARRRAYGSRARLAALLIAACIAAACGEGAERSSAPTVRDSAGVEILELSAAVLERPAPRQVAAEPQVRIGVVEGAPEYQWTRPVAAVRLADGAFAVLEQVPAEVRIFRADGRFLRRVGAPGEGPGEFRRPEEIAVLAGDTIVVYDAGLRRVTWFGPDGDVARDLTLREPGGIRSLRHVALSAGGGLVAVGATTTEVDRANRGRVRERWRVVPVSPGGDAGPPLGEVPGTERAIAVQRGGDGGVTSVNVQGRWWWGDGFVWGTRRGVWTADNQTFEARRFEPGAGLTRIVRVSDAARPFDDALIDSLHRARLEQVDDPELRALWEADFEGRDYPPTVPPVGSVFADAAGRVWIGRIAPPPEQLQRSPLIAVRDWLVVGETPGMLGLPARSHPVWADGEGVLLVRTDPSFDVPYVEWYVFSAPASARASSTRR